MAYKATEAEPGSCAGGHSGGCVKPVGWVTAGFAASVLALAGCGGREAEKEVPVSGIYRSLPEEARGWRKAGRDATYDRRNLFDYIDGGAELYLTYDFRSVFVRRYAKEGAPESEIVLDVYDMGSAEEAYGIFSAEREDEPVGIGRDSECGGGLLRFWKGRYFVSLVAIGDGDEAESAMKELARGVAAAIPDGGEMPRLAARLPQPGLKIREIRYFHSPIVLNNHYFVSSENLLEIGRDTPAVMARYDRDGSRPLLLMIQYPDPVRAETASARFRRFYMPDADTAGLARMENGRWTMARVRGDLVAIVFEAANAEQAGRLLSEALEAQR